MKYKIQKLEGVEIYRIMSSDDGKTWNGMNLEFVDITHAKSKMDSLSKIQTEQSSRKSDKWDDIDNKEILHG